MTNQNFKPGDKVICIDNESYGLSITIGETYTVDEPRRGGCGSNLITLKERPNIGGIFSRRFKLTTHTPKRHRIVITQRANDWRVHFEDNPKKWECAKTYTEALGKLMISYYKDFNISKIAVEEKKITVIAGE